MFALTSEERGYWQEEEGRSWEEEGRHRHKEAGRCRCLTLTGRVGCWHWPGHWQEERKFCRLQRIRGGGSLRSVLAGKEGGSRSWEEEEQAEGPSPPPPQK